MASWDTGTAYTTGQPIRTGTPFSSQGMVYSGAIGNWADSYPVRSNYAGMIAGAAPQTVSEGPRPSGMHQASGSRKTVSHALAEGGANPDLSRYLTGAAASRSNSVTGFQDPFADALDRFIANAPGKISIYSGYRDQNLQNKLFQNAVAKYGSESAARKWVARNSNHTAGIAADLRFESPAVRKWAHENAKNYGLNFRLGHEPWHVEYAGGRGSRAPSARSVPSPQPRGQGSSERMMRYAARELNTDYLGDGSGPQTFAELPAAYRPNPRGAVNGYTMTAYAPQPDTAPFDAVMGNDGTYRLAGGNVPDPRMRPDRPAPVSEAPAGDYTVQSGDNLWTIAEQSLGDGQRWQEIAQANGIDDPRSLQVGQTLRIPGSQSRPAESMTRPEDYITGRVSGQTPDRLQAGNYRSRADQIPTPPSNPRRDPNGFPIDPYRPATNDADGRHTELTTTFDAAEVGQPGGIVTIPTVIEGRRVSEAEARDLFARGLNPPVQQGFASFGEADRAAEARSASIERARRTGLHEPRMPSPRPRPQPPQRPGVGTPIGNLIYNGMSDAERQQIKDEIQALREKQGGPQFPQSSVYDGRDISTANSPFAAGIQSYDPEIERAMVDRMRQLDAQGVPYDQATQIAINEARAAQMGQPVFVSRDGVRIFAAR